MRLRLAVPDELDDQDRKAALDAALESVTRSVTGLVRRGIAPPAAGAIKAKLVRWHPEPPGDEHFDLPSVVLKRGHGDCDDLAPWHAGSLRAAGIDPGARAFVKKSGPGRWHALVRRSDGSIEDPSLAAGMGRGVNGPGGVVGAGPALHRPMSAEGRLCIAICPSRDPRHPGVWFARCDVPDKLEPWDWSTSAAASHPARALLRAVKTVRKVAGPEIELEDDARLAALNDLVCGADPEEVADALARLCGDQIDVDGCVSEVAHSVGFFGDLIKAIAKPITSAADFVRNPSLKSFGRAVLSPVTSPLEAARGVYHIPGLHQVLKAGIPIAATAFGGPFGAAGGALATQLLERGLPRSFGDVTRMAASAAPAMIPGGGGGLAALFGGGGAGPSIANIANMLAARGAPAGAVAPLQRYLWEAGKVVRPWGGAGPAVMRF